MGKKKVEPNKPDESNASKKVKLFSAKEFRQEINTSNVLTALQKFLEALKSSDNENYVLEYLESGGNCLELLQILENNSTIPPTPIFEIITYILLKISSAYPQYQNSSYETCRYLLKNYVTVINKMIGLSSSTPERKSCLKLLTALVAFSPVLAKDVLLNVNFHTANVELLTKHTGDKDSVRDHFIRFLTAYLVDGHYPALSVLLEKKGFFTSIISGLKFDSVDTLCLVIPAMKNFILENPSVSKTAKMKTFNTVVIKDIVNLYNWKGPGGFSATKKNKPTKVTVDEVEKSRVNEVVHDFLITLCTSHKYGVIFKDHLVGLGKKNQNPLLYTVLESLDRPWEHSYASEFVTKMCVTCPDLTKTLWTNIKTFLEPRMSQKWIIAMKFSINLVKQLQPNCIQYCIHELTELQIFQIMQCLVLPLPVLKTIITENFQYETPSVKQYVISLLLEMLKCVNEYKNYVKTILLEDKSRKFNLLINNCISKNFPDAIKILIDWKRIEEDSPYTSIKYLEIIVDIFNYYKILSPDLLDNLSNSDSELYNLLYQENIDDSIANLQVKIINLFVDLDHCKFIINTKMFSFVIPLLFKIYYNKPDEITLNILNKLFKNTGIFEGCFYEINIWINGILDVKHFDENIAVSIVEILKITSENIFAFLDELSGIQSDSNRDKHFAEVIKNIKSQVEVEEIKKFPVKHKYLSPMVFGLRKFLSENEISKHFKSYMNFVFVNLLHLQTNIRPIVDLINKTDVLSSSIKEYALAWLNCDEIMVLNTKGKLNMFKNCSENFLSGDIKYINSIDFSIYSDLRLNILDMIVFYLTNMLNNNILTPDLLDRFKTFSKTILKESNNEVIERVLCNPIILQNTNFLSINTDKSQGYCTAFLVDTTKYLLDSKINIDLYLNIYREKLLNSILKILNKPQKYDNILVDIKSLLEMYQLGYNECLTILKAISQLYNKFTKHTLNIDILTYCLKQFTNECIKNYKLKLLNEDIFVNLTDYFVYLTKNEPQSLGLLSKIFLDYLRAFPHNLGFLTKDLFKSIIELEEPSKEIVNLAAFLLEKNDYLDIIKSNVNKICDKKPLLLPLLKVITKKDVESDLLQKIYDLTLPSFTKMLHKPQKVGQHFHQNYQGLIKLIDVVMPLDNCKTFWDKVQKFDSTEIFHVHLLKTICLKYLNGFESITNKEINNILMTFIHLQVNMFKKNLKTDLEINKALEIVSLFNEVLNKLKSITLDKDLKNTAKNETLKLYVKFCLKFGVSGKPSFLQSLHYLIEILGNYLEKGDGQLILDMLTSHSEFLETVLGEHTETKLEILSLYLVLCKIWPEFMERNFVPLLLASYTAQVNKCDRIILVLLKMFETKPELTHFYDFKPFLWGRAAATHYSVKQQIETALLRQPKVGDVLDILQEDLVVSTITNYAFKDHLRSEENELLCVENKKSYDLVFMLPLFSQLLAPEQQVQTYKFTRSGALSLTVIGLSSSDIEIRQAACHVLARFHYHIDARQTGKDNLLWIRYIEAVCKGTALLPDFKLNNFAAIYLARMALILTQPNHIMYLPLSQHLTAKSSLDFSTVPELYTFLHSSDVNYKEHRNFTLELLRDGLRTEKDFLDFMKSMAFKLFSELYCSSVSDSDTKLLILDVINSICGISLGVKVICDNNSFLIQAYTDISNILKNHSIDKFNSLVVGKYLEILLKILNVNKDRHTCFMVYNIVNSLVVSDLYLFLIGNSESIYFEIIFTVQGYFPDMYNIQFYNAILSKLNDPLCSYLEKYGCDFMGIEEFDKDCKFYYIRVFIKRFLEHISKK